jgi:hypothetical protein
MLTSRLEGNECSRARASHAIRSATSDEHWLEIDSTSVDKLVNSDLPPLERQVDNFLKWMSDELGDDQIGTVQLPENLDHLAGVVGAVDGERIEALMREMQKENLIEWLSDNRVRLTQAGWSRLGQSARMTQTVDSILTWEEDDHSADMAYLVSECFCLDDTISAHCPNSGPDRKTNVLKHHIEYELLAPEHSNTLYWINDYRILKCGVVRSSTCKG